MRSSAAKSLKHESKASMSMRNLHVDVTKVDEVEKSLNSTHQKNKDESSLKDKDSKKKIEKKPRAISVKKSASTSLKASADLNSKLGLKISAGLNMGTLYPLKKRRNVIGRRVDAAFPIQDERASRDHAVIEYKKGHFMLSDLNSTNGTFLNNKAVTKPTYLKEGDHIRIGSSVFVVEPMNEKNPEMVEKWSSMTTIVPRASILEKAKKELDKPIIEKMESYVPRWKHLTTSIAIGHHKHLIQARFFGIALAVLVIAAAILTSL